jgi:hypothetical protein
MPSALLMRLVQMISEHVGECPTESEVWLVIRLMEPQQKKLGHHAMVELDFGFMRDM